MTHKQEEVTGHNTVVRVQGSVPVLGQGLLPAAADVYSGAPFSNVAPLHAVQVAHLWKDQLLAVRVCRHGMRPCQQQTQSWAHRCAQTHPFASS